MATKFEAEIQFHSGFTRVQIKGAIDEDNELAALAGRVHGDAILLELAEVQDINNCGARDWVRFLEEIEAPNRAIVWTECSPAVVAKLNTVSNFVGNGYVKSFYVPYYCRACEAEKAVLMDMDEAEPLAPECLPTCRCDTCDTVMEFDDLPEGYFRFVEALREKGPSPLLSPILTNMAPSGGPRKMINRTDFEEGSSFAALSSSAVREPESAVSSVASGTRAALRRLRSRTGLKTVPLDQAGQGQPRSKGFSHRLLVSAVIMTALAAVTGVVWLVMELAG